MAMLVDVNEYGIDVAKDWLDIFLDVIRNPIPGSGSWAKSV